MYVFIFNSICYIIITRLDTQSAIIDLNSTPEHIPVIIKSYIELHNGWITRRQPIDLAEVFRYQEDSVVAPYIGADIALPSEGRKILLTKPGWMQELSMY